MFFSKNLSLIIIIISYIFVFSITNYFAKSFHSENYVTSLILWDFISTNILFILAFLLNAVSIIDFYWKICPLFQITTILIQRLQTNQFGLKHCISYLLICFWGIRLLSNYIRSWPGLNFLDFRVAHYKNKVGKILFWPAAYVIFFLVSGTFLFLAKLPFLLYFTESSTDFDTKIFFGSLLILAGVLIEAVADNQLYQFRKSKSSQKICDEGLWYYSRHPNYLGEVLFWWGAFFVSIEIYASHLWIIIGPILMTIMFVCGSAPWMDEHLCEKRPEYKSYMKTNKNLIFPWSRKKI